MRPGPVAIAGAAFLAAASCVQASATSDPAVLAAGERSYQKCYACHSLEGPDATTQGPSLRNLVGRRVATETGFDYSPAMHVYAAKQSTWTREALDDFIADPHEVVPGNEMGFFGIDDPSERRALIEYLAIN